ncbi:MAG TPA: hypothetical protein VFP68_10600 [Burkholderiaceae bacterium]|nr:hypothetical protein [Burkholderiaceae bacterium]
MARLVDSMFITFEQKASESSSHRALPMVTLRWSTLMETFDQKAKERDEKGPLQKQRVRTPAELLQAIRSGVSDAPGLTEEEMDDIQDIICAGRRCGHFPSGMRT